MLADVQFQVQFIGNAHGGASQSPERFGQSRLEVAAGFGEMFDGQPRYPARFVNQRPLQRTALQCFADFLCGVTLQAVLEFWLVQHSEISHQKQPGNACSLQAFNQGVDCQHLLDRTRYDGFFHVFAVER
ncbi:hypothetical protein D3C85_1587320 [compost metagenome]